MPTEAGPAGRRVATGCSAPADAGIGLAPAARFGRDPSHGRHAASGSLLETLAVPAHGVDVRQRMAHGIADRGKDGMHGITADTLSRELKDAGFEAVSSIAAERAIMVVVSKPKR